MEGASDRACSAPITEFRQMNAIVRQRFLFLRRENGIEQVDEVVPAARGQSVNGICIELNVSIVLSWIGERRANTLVTNRRNENQSRFGALQSIQDFAITVEEAFQSRRPLERFIHAKADEYDRGFQCRQMLLETAEMERPQLDGGGVARPRQIAYVELPLRETTTKHCLELPVMPISFEKCVADENYPVAIFQFEHCPGVRPYHA